MFNFNFKSFETAILENDYFVSDHFFNEEQIKSLQSYFQNQIKDQKFTPAKIGKSGGTNLNTEIRNDHILWIDDWSQTPELKVFQNFLEKLSTFCREKFYLPLKRYESHFAYYPKGSFYKKHVDQHKNSPYRQVSIVLYLSDFQAGNSGELRIYPKDNNLSPIEVEPHAGRIVVFQSAGLIHEVLTTNADRFSITAWIRDDEN